ncbi:MAG: CapA family protein [Trueperaceae bacterium]|nr:MAG: CapA family protein [Trueperaceae bacterium]
MKETERANSITIAAVGDLMLRRPFTTPLPGQALQTADLRVANLEAPITDRGVPADKLITMRMPPPAASWVKELGFEVVSLANNHTLDYGTIGLSDTMSALERVGIAYAGAGNDIAGALRPDVREVKGVKIATVALAATVPTGSAAGIDRPGIAPLRVRVSFASDGAVNDEQPGTPPWVHTEVVAEDLERALSVVRQARELADIVLVQMHWGVPPEWSSPFQGDLAEYQRPLAYALVEVGASVILGHHPHALHGVERYRGAGILYSLGNFIFHPQTKLKRLELQRPAPPYKPVYSERNRQSLIANLRFHRAGGGWQLRGIELIPCRLDDRGEARAVTQEQAKAVLEVVKGSDATRGVAFEVHGGRAHLDFSDEDVA